MSSTHIPTYSHPHYHSSSITHLHTSELFVHTIAFLQPVCVCVSFCLLAFFIVFTNAFDDFHSLSLSQLFCTCFVSDTDNSRSSLFCSRPHRTLQTHNAYLQPCDSGFLIVSILFCPMATGIVHTSSRTICIIDNHFLLLQNREILRARSV